MELAEGATSYYWHNLNVMYNTLILMYYFFRSGYGYVNYAYFVKKITNGLLFALSKLLHGFRYSP